MSGLRKGEAVTTQGTPEDQPLTFISLKEANPTPRPEQTDAEIEAWIEREIRADKKMLDLLATL